MPERVQRKRTKGWRMPPNTVYVGRPTRWGNPNLVAVYGWHGRGVAAAVFEDDLRHGRLKITEADVRLGLSGKNLACWCPLTDADGFHVPCHADVLLRIANTE